MFDINFTRSKWIYHHNYHRYLWDRVYVQCPHVSTWIQCVSVGNIVLPHSSIQGYPLWPLLIPRSHVFMLESKATTRRVCLLSFWFNLLHISVGWFQWDSHLCKMPLVQLDKGVGKWCMFQTGFFMFEKPSTNHHKL